MEPVVQRIEEEEEAGLGRSGGGAGPDARGDAGRAEGKAGGEGAGGGGQGPAGVASAGGGAGAGAGAGGPAAAEDAPLGLSPGAAAEALGTSQTRRRTELIHRTFEHALYLSGRPQMDFVAFHQATGELWEMTREPLLAIVATTSEDLAADLVTRL